MRTDFPIVTSVPDPLAFVTISGSHLYGFPSPDSDYDLRGAHCASVRSLLSLTPPRETFENEDYVDGRVDCEIVTHEIRKYLLLMLKNNGYVLEQIFSPLIVVEGVLPELRELAKKCITRQHYNHYCGFSKNEWTQFHRRPEKHVKRLLYVFRVILTGIYLLRTGRVEPNIIILNDEFKLPYMPDLIAQKLNGYEAGELAAGHGVDFYHREYEKLAATLDDEYANSKLPDNVTRATRQEVDAFLHRLRGLK